MKGGDAYPPVAFQWGASPGMGMAAEPWTAGGSVKSPARCAAPFVKVGFYGVYFFILLRKGFQAGPHSPVSCQAGTGVNFISVSADADC